MFENVSSELSKERHRKCLRSAIIAKPKLQMYLVIMILRSNICSFEVWKWLFSNLSIPKFNSLFDHGPWTHRSNGDLKDINQSIEKQQKRSPNFNTPNLQLIPAPLLRQLSLRYYNNYVVDRNEDLIWSFVTNK